MTLEECCDLVLAFARVLYVNGQSTDQTLVAAERVGDALGLRTRIMPRWGELLLEAEDGAARLIRVTSADPAGVDMHRVAAAARAIDDLGVGRLAPAAAASSRRIPDVRGAAPSTELVVFGSRGHGALRLTGRGEWKPWKLRILRTGAC